MDLSKLATKDDIQNTIGATKEELRSEIATTKEELRTEIAATKTELKKEINTINIRLSHVEETQTKILQVLDRLERHAVQNEYYWKAYLDVDKIHEARMAKHEKRTALIEKHLKLNPPVELLPQR